MVGLESSSAPVGPTHQTRHACCETRHSPALCERSPGRTRRLPGQRAHVPSQPMFSLKLLRSGARMPRTQQSTSRAWLDWAPLARRGGNLEPAAARLTRRQPARARQTSCRRCDGQEAPARASRASQRVSARLRTGKLFLMCLEGSVSALLQDATASSRVPTDSRPSWSCWPRASSVWALVLACASSFVAAPPLLLVEAKRSPRRPWRRI